MADPYTGEIRIFPFAYAPYNWAFCTGQTIQVVQNSALYSIIGNMYGGTAGQSFMLPNFQGCAPIHQGTGAGLTTQQVAETGGSNTVTLTQNQMPNHNHGVVSYLASVATTSTPTNQLYMSRASVGNAWSTVTPPNTMLAPPTLQNSGGSYAHENRQPYLALNFCICLYGYYPVKPS